LKSFKETKLRFFLFIIIAFWFAGIWGEYLPNIFPSLFPVLPILEHNYSIVCHGEPEKLIRISGYTSYTCARCTGIYLGALIISFISIFGLNLKISLKLLILSSLPIFLDIILYSIGVYSYKHPVSLATGLFLGSIGFLYIQNCILELLTKVKGIN
jgi:uncharacterized membrane protein